MIFYKGSANSVERRLFEYNDGQTPSIKPYRPFRLVYYEAYVSQKTARLREKAVKKSGSISVPLLRRTREGLSL
ncbi:hypothetical protein COY07_04805 [Candidatus Peregrinibacteria bacterium CG_4_10_14_0_2_um_filter_43_11]|nr:MAG: hypothetical protein COY07_04805 [Candidatus Peregrinibacteria bacterium CG_4_10_14_0_2_um_filter_43_11]